jgi:hypothetical protein
MRKELLILLGAFLVACGSSNALSDSGCPGPWSSDPCVTGTVCDYSSPLACEAGCSGGSYSRWECINGQWQDSMHTAGAPTCYCPPIDAQAKGALDAGATDAPAAVVDSSLDNV